MWRQTHANPHCLLPVTCMCFPELLKLLVAAVQERMNSNYAELSGAFKSSLEGLARTVQDLHSIIK